MSLHQARERLTAVLTELEKVQREYYSIPALGYEDAMLTAVMKFIEKVIDPTKRAAPPSQRRIQHYDGG